MSSSGRFVTAAAGEHVPAIAFTATREEDRRLALTSGFRHVAVPVEPTALVRALATVLER